MKKRILAIDQGTTATKTYTLDSDGHFAFCRSVDHRQIYPQPGWVEHDPETLLSNVQKSIEAASDIDAIGIDNQGETVIAWDGANGLPIYNAIVWQDQRTTGFTEALKAQGAEHLTLARAGLPLDPYFSASKLRWILKNVPQAAKLHKKGQLKLGTSDSFFIYRLTGEYATDVTTASRTSLMNLATCDWDPELCEIFEIPLEILPKIRPTAAHFGVLTAPAREIPITASVVDQQAALLGHGCLRSGQIKASFGTGVFVLANVGEHVHGDHTRGIISTVAWQLTNQKPVYAVDAGAYNAGSAVNWARNLGLFTEFADINHYDRPSALSRGLVFVPALSGLACPYWDRSAAGLWLGMSLETTREDLCQAVLEGIALRTAQLLDAIFHLTGKQGRLSVDGGLINNTYLCQFLADVTQCKIVVPVSPDITAYGTGRLALIGSGMVKNLSDLTPAQKPQKIITPRNDLTYLKARFDDAVTRSRNWR
ncbi:Glycerol kinase (EC [Olavius sp. associated proteobacterium Delta 1]|nr:Glycerol kinase (EC [Olavius sp. associated proteobacterium Delta 1]